MGLHASQLYNWRSKARLSQDKSVVDERLLLENARLNRRLEEQSEELATVKKGHSVLRQKPEVKHAFMQIHAGEFKITTMSRVLDSLAADFTVFDSEQDSRRNGSKTHGS